jgi:hypothetical protein
MTRSTHTSRARTTLRASLLAALIASASLVGVTGAYPWYHGG